MTMMMYSELKEEGLLTFPEKQMIQNKKTSKSNIY